MRLRVCGGPRRPLGRPAVRGTPRDRRGTWVRLLLYPTHARVRREPLAELARGVHLHLDGPADWRSRQPCPAKSRSVRTSTRAPRRRQAALRRVATLVAEGSAPEGVFNAVAREVGL